MCRFFTFCLAYKIIQGDVVEKTDWKLLELVAAASAVFTAETQGFFFFYYYFLPTCMFAEGVIEASSHRGEK